MSDIHDEFERIVQDTIRKLKDSTEKIEACTRHLEEQNRKARFIARCFGLNT